MVNPHTRVTSLVFCGFAQHSAVLTLVPDARFLLWEALRGQLRLLNPHLVHRNLAARPTEGDAAQRTSH